MRGYRVRVASNWLLLGWLLLAAHAIAMQEEAGESGMIAPVPQRIVSLDLCMDWMLAYHGAGERVAALSPLHRRFPLPFPMPDWPVHDGTLEQIYRLQPDLILVGEYNALLLSRRLHTLGQPVEVVSLPQSLTQIEQYEQRVLQLMGQPIQLARPAPVLEMPAMDAPRLLLLGANGIGTGTGTFEDQIVQQAGWRNHLQVPGYVRLDMEQLLLDPPEAILWAAPDAPALANRFAEHPALQGRIAAKGWLATDYWRWQCPGPWTWELIDQLRQQREQWP